MPRRRRDGEPTTGRWGLPSTIAGTNHLGRQLDRKRRGEQAPPPRAIPRERRTPPGPLPPPTAIDAWLASRGLEPFPFQRETWDHIVAGRSGLLHATTGAGKTYAAWLGALRRVLERAASLAPARDERK